MDPQGIWDTYNSYENIYIPFYGSESPTGPAEIFRPQTYRYWPSHNLLNKYFYVPDVFIENKKSNSATMLTHYTNIEKRIRS